MWIKGNDKISGNKGEKGRCKTCTGINRTCLSAAAVRRDLNDLQPTRLELESQRATSEQGP